MHLTKANKNHCSSTINNHFQTQDVCGRFDWPKYQQIRNILKYTETCSICGFCANFFY